MNTHPDFARQQVMKCDNKINNNSVNKTGKQSNSATILIIHAPVRTGKSSFRVTSMRAASKINVCTTEMQGCGFASENQILTNIKPVIIK